MVGVAREAELGDHQVGEAERHEAVDLRQPVQAVGSLQQVFRPVPHTLVPAAGVLLQVAEVHGFDEDPGGLGDAAGGVLPQIQRHGEVNGDVVAILGLVHQRVDGPRLVPEQLEVAAVEEGGTDQDHGVSAASGPRWNAQEENETKVPLASK